MTALHPIGSMTVSTPRRIVTSVGEINRLTRKVIMKLALIVASSFVLASLVGCTSATEGPEQSPQSEPAPAVDVDVDAKPERAVYSCGSCLESCIVGGGSPEENINEYRFCRAACCG